MEKRTVEVMNWNGNEKRRNRCEKAVNWIKAEAKHTDYCFTYKGVACLKTLKIISTDLEEWHKVNVLLNDD